MIHIEKDGEVAENINLRVASATGNYEDAALIEVYDVSAPELVAGAFQAQYIKYGSVVYGFNGHMELGAAILKNDPESTHTSASYVRMSRNLLSQMNGGSLESASLDKVISVEKKNIEDQAATKNDTGEYLLKETPKVGPIVETTTEESLEVLEPIL